MEQQQDNEKESAGEKYLFCKGAVCLPLLITLLFTVLGWYPGGLGGFLLGFVAGISIGYIVAFALWLSYPSGNDGLALPFKLSVTSSARN